MVFPGGVTGEEFDYFHEVKGKKKYYVVCVWKKKSDLVLS
jgi:hypothetical protein